MDKTRFVLLGGFLGAGKTTLIGQLAKRYVAAGKRVGIITNDQAADLVDTNHLRSQGFNVGEVAGACFCCSFDELVGTADKLAQANPPDVLLAEPVGSCTDLVATVILPMQQILGDRFELAPFGVLLKPSHGKRILATNSNDNPLSGFSPQAEYIFRKQLQEADYLMIGRSDQLETSEVEKLRVQLESVAPSVPVIAVSPKSGEGVDEVMGYIESPVIAGRRLLDIDYDIYAEGEAELGWVNLTASMAVEDQIEMDQLALQLVTAIAGSIANVQNATIAHLKCSVLASDAQSVANVVSSEIGPELGLASGRQASGDVQTIVNARVAMDPGELQSICEAAVRQQCGQCSARLDSMSAHSLRPGRPTPTHRVGA